MWKKIAWEKAESVSGSKVRNPPTTTGHCARCIARLFPFGGGRTHGPSASVAQVLCKQIPVIRWLVSTSALVFSNAIMRVEKSGFLVPGCTEKSGMGQRVRFHVFPVKDDQRCQLWLRAINNPTIGEDAGMEFIKGKTICSLHFKLEDYDVNLFRMMRHALCGVPNTDVIQ